MSRYQMLRSNKEKVFSKTKNLINEAKRESEPKEALGAEEVIAIFMRNQSLSNSKISEYMRDPQDDDFRFLNNYFLNIIKEKINIDEAVKRVQNGVGIIKKLNLPKSAKQYGSTKQSPVKTWSDVYGGASNPIMPKTDVLNESIHHSVKLKGSIQVLDSGVKQAGALFLYALDQTRDLYDDFIADTIESQTEIMQSSVLTLSRIPDKDKYDSFYKDYLMKNPKKSGMTAKEKSEWKKSFTAAAEKAGVRVSGGDIRKGTVSLSDDAKIELEKFNIGLKKLDTLIKDIWTNSEVTGTEFKRVLLRESMSGEFMFGNSDASANSVFVWQRGFSGIYSMTIDAAVEETLASAVIPKFGTKSSGDTMYPKAKIEIDLEKIQNKIDLGMVSDGKINKLKSNIFESMVKQSRSKINEISLFVEYSHNVMSEYSKRRDIIKNELKEGILNEDTAWEKVKNWFKSLLNSIKIISEKLRAYIDEIKNVVNKSVPKIFHFFGLSVDVPTNAAILVKF